jgi:hypothetical protein
MNTDDKIADFLARAETHPAPSKLEPYHELIRTLRQRRWTYKAIAASLRDEFGISAAPSSIHAFVKVRAKRRAPPALPPADSPLIAPAPARKPRFHVDA